jgi:hypothetical protein
MQIIRRLATVLALAVLMLCAPPAHAQSSESLVGSWHGQLDAGGMELRVVFHIEQEGDSLTATMDSPDQGATGIPVEAVRMQDDTLTLDVSSINGSYVGVMTDAETIEGTWRQSGQSFPLTLTLVNEGTAEGPARPQHPEPPYPYAEEEVRFPNGNDGITLAGTLTYPEGAGLYPAVVLVSGSGPQNRNAEVMGHRLFHVLADHLTRQGIAVLRYDERGVGESEGPPFPASTTEAYARDAAAAARFLKEQSQVDAEHVGLIGLSEGGLVGPMVHTRHETLAFLVLMAGPAVPGRDIIIEQTARMAAAQGASASAVGSTRTAQQRMLHAVQQAPDSVAAADTLQALFEAQGVPAAQREAQIEQLTAPWFTFFLQYDPRPTLTQLDIPVLALFGEKDLQVPPEQNAEVMQTALEESPSPDATVEVFDGLNHLFQPADTGHPVEYSQIETTMAPEVLERIGGWVREQSE